MPFIHSLVLFLFAYTFDPTDLCLLGLLMLLNRFFNIPVKVYVPNWFFKEDYESGDEETY